MAGSLKHNLGLMAQATNNLRPSNGSTFPLAMKISIYSPPMKRTSTLSRHCYVTWQVAAMGSQLSVQMRESLTLSPSTDPLLSMTGEIWDYQVALPHFGTPSLLRCINLRFAFKGKSDTDFQTMEIWDLDNVSDRVLFQYYPL